jgi:hypothetical protein
MVCKTLLNIYSMILSDTQLSSWQKTWNCNIWTIGHFVPAAIYQLVSVSTVSFQYEFLKAGPGMIHNIFYFNFQLKWQARLVWIFIIFRLKSTVRAGGKKVQTLVCEYSSWCRSLLYTTIQRHLANRIAKRDNLAWNLDVAKATKA